MTQPAKQAALAALNEAYDMLDFSRTKHVAVPWGLIMPMMRNAIEALTAEQATADGVDRPEQILLDTVKFYARKDHWMSPTEDGTPRLLIAHGQSIFPDGWAEAHGALQAYAIAKHYKALTPQSDAGEVG